MIDLTAYFILKALLRNGYLKKEHVEDFFMRYLPVRGVVTVSSKYEFEKEIETVIRLVNMLARNKELINDGGWGE